ncbi:MAG: hypothetical protein K2L07_15465 [Lachnospiraceae bacterium]|nr:hypothetical protein [Lachnospiraceae bacterium]
MERKSKVITAITIVLTIIELIIYYIIKKCGYLNFLSPEDSGLISEFLGFVTPAGIIYLLNYYIMAPALYCLICGIWHLTGHYGRISKYFDVQVKQCISWLIQTPMHWGPLYTSEQCQNANTCESLLALKKTSYDVKYKVIYEQARENVLNNVTDNGLPSKSLNYETVVCTSMILYLIALEKKAGDLITSELEEKFERIARNLWNCKSERGWGVYVETLEPEYSCVANTFWALIALNNYSVAQTEEYASFVKSIYEYSNNSGFGFVIGDRPRLCTTAMAVILYFSLDNMLQEAINQVYDVNTAIDYIFDNFCIKNIQCETETLRGIDLKNPGCAKAPWTHMTMGFAMEAISLAYKNKKLSLIRMDIYIHKLKKLCNTRLVRLSEQQQCYFIPEGMQLRDNGVYTFPTAYFVMGLSAFINY